MNREPLVDLSDERLIGLCSDLVRCRTLTGEERPAAEVAAAAMRELGYDEVRVDRLGNVVGILRGGAGPTVLLDGHLDTVSVANPDAWSRDPYCGDMVDGAVYGRGAADMKSAVAAMIVAGARVKAAGRPTGAVVVSASVCEELFEGKGFAEVVLAVRPDVVVIGEATELRVNRGGRGRAEVVVETAGVPAHSSTPHVGVNAVYQMMAVLPRLRAMPLPSDPFLGPAILELTDIISAPYPGASVLPVSCRVTFDRRLLVGEDEAAVLDPLRAVLDERSREDAQFKGTVSIARDEVLCYTGATLGGTKFARAWAFPDDHPMVRRALAGLARLGQEPNVGHYRFCTNGSYSGGVARILTLGYGPGREDQAHVTNESLAVDQITRACAGYAALIRSLTAPS